MAVSDLTVGDDARSVMPVVVPAVAGRGSPAVAVPGAPTAAPPVAGRRPLGRQLVLLGATAAALVLVSPVLAKVYGHAGDALALRPLWLALIGALIVSHFLCVWALQRLILRTSNRFDVATSQLAANATSHVAPAGSAVGAGIQLRMLTLAGFPVSRVATALAASTVLGAVAGYIVLPLTVLAASAAGGDIPARLVTAMWSATGFLAALLLVAVVLAVRDGPWRRIAGLVAWVRGAFRRPCDADELAGRLIAERDLIRQALRRRVVLVAFLALAQPMTDFAALYVAVRAVGAHISAATTMAAFVVSNVAGLVPVTPGGLGFVEAGLAHVLTLGGATHPEAHVAIVVYRLMATWIPCLAGFIALALFHLRRSSHAARSAAPDPG